MFHLWLSGTDYEVLFEEENSTMACFDLGLIFSWD